MPPSKWGELPFYMKTNFIMVSLLTLWHGVTSLLNINHKITQSRLACQEKSATFFSNALVPILREREAVQIPQGQQINPSAAIWLELSIAL